jgi:hypothetical protein
VSQQKNLPGGGTGAGNGGSGGGGSGGSGKGKEGEESRNSDHVTIPSPVKNALKTFSVLLDLTTPRPQAGHPTAWSSRDRSFQRMFLDKYSETGQTFSQQASAALSDSEFYLSISPAEMVFYSAFRDLPPLSQGTERTDTELQQGQEHGQGQGLHEEGEERSTITPSFLIQFLLTTSDPQAASTAAQVLSKLLGHLKRSLHFHPTDSELMAWDASGHSWNEFRFKDLKSAGGIFAYDVFCGVFDGLGKIVTQQSEGGGGRGGGGQWEMKRDPLGSLHANLMGSGGRGRNGQQEKKEGGNGFREEEGGEEGLRSLIWEPLLIDLIELLQVPLSPTPPPPLTTAAA